MKKTEWLKEKRARFDARELWPRSDTEALFNEIDRLQRELSEQRNLNDSISVRLAKSGAESDASAQPTVSNQWGKWRQDLEAIGGWANELVSVPAGAVRQMIELGEQQFAALTAAIDPPVDTDPSEILLLLCWARRCLAGTDYYRDCIAALDAEILKGTSSKPPPIYTRADA